MEITENMPNLREEIKLSSQEYGEAREKERASMDVRETEQITRLSLILCTSPRIRTFIDHFLNNSRLNRRFPFLKTSDPVKLQFGFGGFRSIALGRQMVNSPDRRG